MFVRFFDGCEDCEALADEFAAHLPERKVSMAALQGFLMRHKNDPKSALGDITSLLEQSSSISGMASLFPSSSSSASSSSS